MSTSADTEHFRTYLHRAREALLWKLDGLTERQLRMPMTPTGTNLLGLVKHVASVEIGYLNEVFGRPSEVSLPWYADDAPDNADMYATAEESSAQIIALYRRAGELSDATLDALDLDSHGHVPWWGARNPVTLHQILVHLLSDVDRHVGHADILRELIDGQAGTSAEHSNLPPFSATDWVAYRSELTSIAESFE